MRSQLLLFSLFLIFGGSARAGELPVDLLASITSGGAGAASPAEIDFSSIRFAPSSTPSSATGGVSVTAVPDSLEWVRISDVLVFPRIWIHVSLNRASNGVVLYAGALHPLATKNGKSGVDLPIALISNPTNHIDVKIQDGRSATTVSYTAQYVFKDVRSPVFFDPSCEGFGLKSNQAKLAPYDWLYIGCRHETSVKEGEGKSSVVLSVFWNSPSGQNLDDIPLKSSYLVTSVHLNEAPGTVSLRSGDSSVELGYRFSDHLTRGALWMGLGPYEYGFWGGNDAISDTIALATLYGSYLLDDTSRIIAFDATALDSNLNTDFGVYYSFENARAMDRRLAINIMLGVHALGVKTMGSYNVNFGLPQGIELVFHDLFLPLWNLSAGAFLYPPLNGTSYNNVWLRYGSSRFFGEVNYISFQENIKNFSYFSRSLGVSLGIPLGHAF